jgi:hypothetical protein
MPLYKIPPVIIDEKIVNEDGIMQGSFLLFIKSMINLFNNNFNENGIKIPALDNDLTSEENNESLWYSKESNTLKFLIDGEVKTIPFV